MFSAEHSYQSIDLVESATGSESLGQQSVYVYEGLVCVCVCVCVCARACVCVCVCVYVLLG